MVEMAEKLRVPLVSAQREAAKDCAAPAEEVHAPRLQTSGDDSQPVTSVRDRTLRDLMRPDETVKPEKTRKGKSE